MFISANILYNCIQHTFELLLVKNWKYKMHGIINTCTKHVLSNFIKLKI